MNEGVRRASAYSLRPAFLDYERAWPLALKKRIWATRGFRWLAQGLNVVELVETVHTAPRALRLMALGEYHGIWKIVRPDLTEMLIARDMGKPFVTHIKGIGPRP